MLLQSSIAWRNEGFRFALPAPSAICKRASNPPLATAFPGKKPELFNLLWYESLSTFASCTHEEWISLSSKSSFVWFSLICFLRRRKANTEVQREPQ